MNTMEETASTTPPTHVSEEKKPNQIAVVTITFILSNCLPLNTVSYAVDLLEAPLVRWWHK